MPVCRPILDRPGIYFYSSPQAPSKQAAGSQAAVGQTGACPRALEGLGGGPPMLSRWGSEQPEGLQREGAPSDLVRSSDAPHSRPWPSAQTCCLCSHLPVLTCAHLPVLLRRFPTLAIRLPRPQHICSPRVCSHSTPGWSWAPAPCAPAVRVCSPPRGPALPQAAGRVPYGLLPSLVNEGPSV